MRTHFLSVVSFPDAFIMVTSLADLGAFAREDDPLPTLTASQSWPLGMEMFGMVAWLLSKKMREQS